MKNEGRGDRKQVAIFLSQLSSDNCSVVNSGEIILSDKETY